MLLQHPELKIWFGFHQNYLKQKQFGITKFHDNQTEIQMQKLADRLTQLEDAMRQIGSTKRGDTINFDYAPDAGTTISINGVARTKAIPGEDFYQAVLSIFIGNSPVDRELKNGLLGS